ncbi:MAG TPA: CBS domain-containing protein [Candidatus Dormibacteraeota bacterium]
MIPVKQVMNRKVISFRPETPVDEIAKTLSKKKITGAPVMGEDGAVVGIVSEIDVVTKRGATAQDIMSPHVISIGEDTGIVEAAGLLAGERIRRVPVLGAQGKMVGILSRSDVLDFFTRTHWSCRACGHSEHGLQQPESCRHCGGTDFTLERTQPGS